MLLSFQSFSQLKRWILGCPYYNSTGIVNTAAAGVLKFFEMDFSGAVPAFSQRILGTSITSIVSSGTNEPVNNGIDSSGNLSFYVFVNCTSPFSGTILDATYFVAFDPSTGKDEVFASIPGTGGGAASEKNIEVVKREGFTDQYYVIYKTACINNQANDFIRYVIVNMVTRTITAPVTISTLNHNEGMAITPIDCGTGNRWLFFAKYVGGDLDVYRSSISSGGITLASFVTTILIPGNASFGQGDIDISPTGDKIAIANLATSNVNEDVIVLDLNLSSGSLSSQRWINNPSNYIYSVEFSPDGQRLYMARSGTSLVANQLYNVGVTASNYTVAASDLVAAALVPGLINIEVGYDQNLYFNGGNYNTDLFFISNPNAIAASNIVSQTPANSFGLGNAVGITLPDQIDGPDANSTLNPSISATATSICAGQSATLTGSGGTSYQWSGGATDTTALINVSPIISTNYYLQVSNGSCVGYDTVTIVVNALPVGIISGSANICSGQSTTLTASGASSYQWSGGSTATTSSITVSPLVTTGYTVTPINGGCSGTPVSVTVNVTPSPIASINFSDDSICAGTIVTLTASGGTTYQWSGGSTATTATINVSPAVTTSYFLQAANGSCIDSDTFTLYSYPVPIGIISGSTNICSGQSTILTASGASSYQWSGGSTATTSSISVSPLITTSYTVTPINGGCAGTPLSVTVNVTASPVATISFTDDSICTGQSVILTASGGTSYQWSGGAIATITTINVTPALNTFYYLQATNGTCVDNDTQLVVVVPYPIALITGNIIGCGPLSVAFNNESSNATTYFWDFGDGSTSILMSPIHIYSDSGSYSVSLITTNIAGCSDTININSYVTVLASPSAGIEVIQGNTIDNNSITFQDLSSDGTNCITYFGDGDSLIGCNWNQITHNYPDNGIYTITQIISNGTCIDTVIITVLAESMSTIYVPNSFSPNGNGLNDIFNVYVSGVDNFKLMIFDRWGELIFETTDQYKGWDGIYKGLPVEQDVYVWKFDYTTKNTGDQQRIGHVTVVR